MFNDLDLFPGNVVEFCDQVEGFNLPGLYLIFDAPKIIDLKLDLNTLMIRRMILS
jgi:hypothetical protein